MGLDWGWARLTALLAVSVLIAGCQTDSAAPPATAVEAELVWAVVPVDAPAHQQTAQRWNEMHPETPVRIEWLPEEADGQRRQMRLELSAGGDGFDVLCMDVVWTGEFAQHGWLEPLDDLAEAVEDVSLPGPLESARWGGRMWAAPYSSNAAFLYYRSDLVDEVPTTWDELMTVGLEVGDEHDMVPYLGQGAAYEGLVVNYLELLWGAGGELLSEDGTSVLLGSDGAALRALEFMREANVNGFYSPAMSSMHEEDARQTFLEGRAVFMRNWPYAYGSLSDPETSPVAGRFGIAPLPTFHGEGTVSAVGGLNNAVSAYSRNTEAAKAFVEFVATDPAVQRGLAEHPLPPTMASIYEELGDDPVFAVLAQVFPHSRSRPAAPAWNAMSVALQRGVFTAYSHEMTPEEAIDELQEELARLLDQP